MLPTYYVAAQDSEDHSMDIYCGNIRSFIYSL